MEAVIPGLILVVSISSGNSPFLEVEKAYWDCEYAALQGAVDLDKGAACNDIFELLKKHKFGGNFQAFLPGGGKTKTGKSR